MHDLLTPERTTTLVFWAVLSACFYGAGILSAFHCLWNCRTSQGAIAWSLSLTLFPYLALPAYWVVGRDKFYGFVRKFQSAGFNKRRAEKELDRLDAHRVYYSEELKPAQTGFEKLAKSPLTAGNKVELLIDGEATFAEMFKQIEAAQQYVLVEFFILAGDKLGTRFCDLLSRKAREGVRVYLVYDEFGSFILPRGHVRKMRDAGVKTASFSPGSWTKGRLQFNFRQHRKIVVVDGLVALVGGFNVKDDSLGLNPFYGAWRDTHVVVRGPVVATIQAMFMDDYYWASNGDVPTGMDFTPRPQADGQEAALYLATGPSDGIDSGTLFFIHAINCARTRVWLSTPYFIPLPPVMAAFKAAALRGVEVKVIIPLKRDMILTYLAAHSCMPQALQAGVQIYQYGAGYLHQKAMLIDDEISWVGSSNLDARSFELNFEGNLVVFGRHFNQQVEEMLTRDLGRSHQTSLAECNSKSFLFKLAVRLGRLFEHVL